MAITCACPKTDAHDCARFRFPRFSRFSDDVDDDEPFECEPCECPCHDQWRDDEDY